MSATATLICIGPPESICEQACENRACGHKLPVADPDLWKGGVKNELRHYIVSGLIGKTKKKKKVTAS